MGKFAHLHLHTEFSLLDGAIRINELPDRLLELGMDSCAITDHGVMYGTVSFYKAMKAKGLKPIIGCEVYVAPNSRFDRSYSNNERSYHHLILLAKNNEGLVNLNRLVSMGFTEGFYKKPRIDKELLQRYHEGLICLSACLAGEIPSLITENRLAEAIDSVTWYDSLFGRGNYYLEIQCNSLSEQAIVNATLIKISNKTGIPLVATNDCHYLHKEDSKAHDVLLCIDTGAKLTDVSRMRMETDDFYLKSEEEMREFFSGVPEAVDNTSKIVDMCNVEYDFDTIHLPLYDIPEGFNSHEEYLSYLTYEGLKTRFEVCGKYDEVENYKNRIEYELSVINSMGYTDYYLIVWDFINYAKTHEIMVGPGRGSGAGSLVAYCIGITNIDPLRYNLVFERFLNSERVSMPDFDVDFCYERRQEVIDYVDRKYGKERVAQVITFGTLAAKLCIRDVARALDVPYAVADRVAKLIPESIGMTIPKAMDINAELKSAYETDPQIKEVLDYSMRLEGLPRHTSTHAAGVIISGKPITEIAPLSKNDEATVVQFAKADIESVGLLKFDFLGLRTLTVMRDTADMVYERHGVKINFDALPLDDSNVFEMIGRGDTVGVFQLESKGMTSFMKDLQPNSIEDIIAGISLYRPGPMEQIPRYVECKHNPQKITYDTPLLEPILNVTYGCMVYQEQVMQIVRDLAGFSMGQSDNIRRAMSKKKKSMMEKYRQLFIYGGEDENGKIVRGAVNTGVSAEIADKIFNDVSNFAGYAFNKSHAAAYAVVGYYTAYLKYYYPVEFMAAMMNSFRFNLAQAAWYIAKSEEMGIKILPPDVNLSKAKFAPEGSKSIRIGLSVIKNVGEGAVNGLIEERETNGLFKNFEDFLTRSVGLDINRKMIEALIFASALDWSGYSRATMIATIQTELEKLNRAASSQIQGQMSLFDLGQDDDSGVDMSATGSINIVEMPEYSLMDKLSYEKEMVGIYISGHPLMEYSTCIEKLVTFDTERIREARDNFDNRVFNEDKSVIMAGILLGKSVRVTKAKKQMAVLSFEDLYGTFEAVLFGKMFDEYASRLTKNSSYIIVGKLRMRDDESISFMPDRIYDMPQSADEIKRLLSDRVINAVLYSSGKTSNNWGNYRSNQQNQENTNGNNSAYSTSVNEGKKPEKIRINYTGSVQNPLYMRILNFCVYFHGTTPVEMFIKETNQIVLLDSVCNIDSDPMIINRLKLLCGDSNVEVV
ncbi:MAG: DNA polymerase III subunit alpha [Clostridia bacterium]|nr:DNA polymerase III subunit alpha [Clostridia bacterium]